MLKRIYNKFSGYLYDLGIGKYSPLLKNNSSVKNAATDVQRCFILATGPSIKTQDLSGLKGEFCISVSNFFVHPLLREIEPRFHVFAGSHPPITVDQMGQWWQDATHHFGQNSPTKILLNAKDKNTREQFGVFNKQEIYYYSEGGRFPIDFTRQIPEIQTVVHIAIYLSIYLGIKEIYLLGCDHSWLQHFGQSQHFYKEEQHSFTRTNYSEWSETKDIGDEFKTYASLWDIYRRIRFEAKKNGVNIYNSTPGSLLDIFPRKDLDQVVNTPATHG